MNFAICFREILSQCREEITTHRRRVDLQSRSFVWLIRNAVHAQRTLRSAKCEHLSSSRESELRRRTNDEKKIRWTRAATATAAVCGTRQATERTNVKRTERDDAARCRHAYNGTFANERSPLDFAVVDEMCVSSRRAFSVRIVYRWIAVAFHCKLFASSIRVKI